MKKIQYAIILLTIFFLQTKYVNADIIDQGSKTIITSVGKKAEITTKINGQVLGKEYLKYFKWSSSNKSILTIEQNKKTQKYYRVSKKPGVVRLTGRYNNKVIVIYKIIVKKKSLMNTSGTFQKAKKISLEKKYTKYITNLNNYNQHWYYFNLNNDGVVNFELFADADMYIEMQLVTRDGTNIIKYIKGTNEILSLKSELQSGKFYLRILSYSGSGNYILASNITNTVYKNDGTNNESFQKAEIFKLNSELSGHLGFISSKGIRDVQDWYKINIDRSCLLQISILGTPELKNGLYLYGKNGSSRLTYNYGQDSIVKISKPLQKGTYYLLVNNESGFGEYKISNEVICPNTDQNDGEKNDSFQYANLLPVGIPMIGLLGYWNDDATVDEIDWYRVDTYSDEDFSITVIPDDTLKDVRVSIYQSDGNTRIARKYGNDEVITITKEMDKESTFQPTTYYIAIGYERDGSYGKYEIIRN